MSNALLFDTDILIEFLRGHPKAESYFETILDDIWILSAITVAELYAGMRASEENELRDFLSLFETVNLTGEIARTAGALRNQYGKSHGTGLADAVIAASAASRKAQLLTFNVRHYPMMEELIIPWKRD